MTYPPPPGLPGGYPPPYGEPQYQPAPYPVVGEPGQPPYAAHQPPYPGQPGGYAPYGYPAAYPVPGYPAPGYPYAAYPTFPQPPARVAVPAVGWALLAISLVTMLAATMPWATVKGFNISVAGTEGGDGVLSIICAAVVASMGLVIGLAHGRLWASITACLFASVITLIGIVDLADVNNLASGDSFVADVISVGPGLVLTVVCGVVLVLASIVAIAKRAPRPV